MASTPSLPCSAVARYEYKSAEEGELSLKKHEQVTVEQINESGWCLATSGDRTGWVPATYLDIGKTAAPKQPTKQAPKAPLSVTVESSGTKQPAATTAKAASKPAATPKPSPTPTTTAPKSSTLASPTPSSTTTRTSTSAKPSPAVKSPPPKAEPAKTPVRKSTKPVKAAATFDDDDMPPPPPSSPPPSEMPPPPPEASDGPLPDELRGDDADTTPESSDADEEEKPQKKLPRRKKLQDIMQNEKEAAANEIFKMFDDREDDFDVGADGEFDQDKWISEMLDTEDDPPPPPDEVETYTPVKHAPRSEPETKKASSAKSKRSPVKVRSETIAERERARTELQTAISLDKKKKVEKGVTNLDLSYVTDRIIAMGCPSESGASKNNISNYKKFFKQYHDNHVRIYNLAAGKTYAPEKMNPFPVNTSFQFEAGNVPAFHTTLDVCKSLSDWLSSDDLNVAVLHCNEGARTGLILCCYLLFTAVCNSAAQALRYYAAFRGKESMSGMCPSQVRYLNYFETYAILVKKQTDSGGLSQFLPGTEEEPTTPVKPGAVRETRSASTKGPPLLRRGVLDFILPDQHVHLKDVTLVPVPARFAADSVWFRITHTEFTYESKGNLRGTKNMKQGKLQIVVKDKSDKGAPPLMHGDLKFELFNAKGLRNEKIYQCWFNTRFLEDANMDETVEASLEEIKRLESKSIQKWDASDKQLYQEAMENVRKYRKKEIVTADDTPPTPTVGGDLKDKHMPAVWDEVEIEGRDYDVLQLHLDKKKLDGLCTDATKNKITAGEFTMTLTFHRPKQREAPPARSMSPPPTKGHR